MLDPSTGRGYRDDVAMHATRNPPSPPFFRGGGAGMIVLRNDLWSGSLGVVRVKPLIIARSACVDEPEKQKAFCFVSSLETESGGDRRQGILLPGVRSTRDCYTSSSQ